MAKLFRPTFAQRGYRLCGGLLLASSLMLWLVAAKSVTAQPPPAPLLKGGVEESYIVVGITQFNADTYDVKLKNPRTGYVHSVTIYVDINISLNLRIGDRVRERREGGQVILTRERGTPSQPPGTPQEGVPAEPGQPGTPPSWPPQKGGVEKTEKTQRADKTPPHTGPTQRTPPQKGQAGCRPGGPLPTRNQEALKYGRDYINIGQEIDLLDEAIAEKLFEGTGLTSLLEGIALPVPVRVIAAANDLKTVSDMLNYKKTLEKRKPEIFKELREQYPQKQYGRLAEDVINYYIHSDWPPQNIVLTLTGHDFQDGTIRRGWASGKVIITTPHDGVPVRSADLGRTRTIVARKGPWKCGAEVVLWAVPSKGSHFDHWASPEGLCAGPSPTCETWLKPNATNSDHDIRAYFAITVD